MGKRVISFHYTLTDPTGKTLDSSIGNAPLTFLENGGQIIPGLEKELQKSKTGEKKRVLVKSAEAYGTRDPKNVVEVSLDKMPTKQIKVGDRFHAGNDIHSPVVTAIKVTNTHVTLDGNHPLSGMDLTFDVEVMEVRDATHEEISHGHVHGAGGHHH